MQLVSSGQIVYFPLASMLGVESDLFLGVNAVVCESVITFDSGFLESGLSLRPFGYNSDG